MNRIYFLRPRIMLFVIMLTLSLFLSTTAKPVSAATLVDTLVLDLREQVKKNCPEKTDTATRIEKEFGACVQTNFTLCTATRPNDPLSCANPAAEQCRNIVDAFLTTCARAVGGNPVPAEVIEFRVKAMKIRSMEGDVRIQHRGKWDADAKDDEEITEGDEIFTGFDSSVVLTTDQGDVILLKSGSQIRIAEKSEKRFEIKLEKGEVKYEIKPATGPTRPDVRIVSPTVTASVRGTIFIVRAMETDVSEVLVSEGIVAVTHNATGKESSVSAGQKLTATANSLSTPEPLTVQDKELFADNTVRKDTRNILFGIAGGGILAVLITLTFLARRKRS